MAKKKVIEGTAVTNPDYVTMTKGGVLLEGVFVGSVKEHERLGWKVVKPEEKAADNNGAELPAAQG